jgi:hypothetical protein
MLSVGGDFPVDWTSQRTAIAKAAGQRRSERTRPQGHWPPTLIALALPCERRRGKRRLLAAITDGRATGCGSYTEREARRTTSMTHGQPTHKLSGRAY